MPKLSPRLQTHRAIKNSNCWKKCKMLYRKLTCLATTAALALCPLALAQTSTKCNPLTTTCPSDDALGGASSSDFTAGAPGDFTSFGPVSYTPSGAVFSVSKSDDSPTLTSNWYIMFGKVSIVVKAASGVGIVSSLVLESDDLDEIDYEWLGSTASSVQSNYFGRGITGSYNRGGVHSAPTSQSAFNTYDVEWTSGQITWSIDGTVVRTLTPAQAAASGNTYPQTPMQVKIGAWSAGDPSNAPGTVAWAGGNTNYAAGPYTMLVQSLMVQDYSTGSQYTYGDMSGTYQSIRSTGGAIGSDYNGSDPPALAGGNYVYVPVPFATGRAGYTATNGSVPWNGTVVTVTVCSVPTLLAHRANTSPVVGHAMRMHKDAHDLSVAHNSTAARHCRTKASDHNGCDYCDHLSCFILLHVDTNANHDVHVHWQRR